MCNMKRIILIDFDSLIDELEALSDSYFDINCSDFTIGVRNICRQQGVDAAIEVVRKQKSVDPVKHGKWTYDTDTEDTPLLVCSVCDDWVYDTNYAYCPHCGAKMDMKDK